MMLSIITFSKVITFTWFRQIALENMTYRHAKARDFHHSSKIYRVIAYQTSFEAQPLSVTVSIVDCSERQFSLTNIIDRWKEIWHATTLGTPMISKEMNQALNIF